MSNPGDFPSDIILKNKFYQHFLKKYNSSRSEVLTRCYFNKQKYGCVYHSDIEKIINN